MKLWGVKDGSKTGHVSFQEGTDVARAGHLAAALVLPLRCSPSWTTGGWMDGIADYVASWPVRWVSCWPKPCWMSLRQV